MSSDKNTSAIEFCAGEVRWRKDGLLEQLWHINHIGPTGAAEKTTEEWRWVPNWKSRRPTARSVSIKQPNFALQTAGGQPTEFIV